MTLAEIREIVRTLRNYELADIIFFDWENLKLKDSKFSEFYRILLDPSVETDEEAAFRIYGNAIPDSKYKFLKSRFLSQALNNISHLDLAKAGISDTCGRYTRLTKTCFIYLSSSVLGIKEVQFA